MDLTLGCGGGDYLAGMGVDFLALGAAGLLLARKWPASRWLSVALISWFVSSILPELAPHLPTSLGEYTAEHRSALFVIGCASVALVLPLLPSSADWTARLRARRSPPVSGSRARGLIAFVRVQPDL